MGKKVIGECPICGKDLVVTKLTCKKCDTELIGEFKLSPFNYLTQAQSDFALVFIKNGGNIKMVEKELNISYPTVKKNLDELIRALGFYPDTKDPKLDILEKLKKGEISFEEASKLINKLGE